MNRLTALLDWIDEAAGSLIRLAYLAAGVTAVAAYFGAGAMSRRVSTGVNAALPWVLAFAIETHCYLSARRVRAAWQDRDTRALKVNLGVLAGLLAFSAWNQLGYLSSSGWAPSGASFALPPALAYVVRALVVPGAFMAAALLAPVAQPVSAQVEAEARATLADVFRIARKQRRRMLKQAERSGRDMTAALVELVPDPDVRRIIAHAYAAIGAPVEGAITHALPARPSGELPTAAYEASGVAQTGGIAQSIPEPSATRGELPKRPPTGPGTPARQGVRTGGVRTGKTPAMLRLATPSPEQRIRAVLDQDPLLSVHQVARRAHVSQASASKWAEVVRAERSQVAQ